MKRKAFRSFLSGLVTVLLTGQTLPALAAPAYTRLQEINYVSFDELKSLSKDPEAKGPLKDKLYKFWRTPLISNEAFYQGAEPLKPKEPLLGPIIRVATWNIEKSMNVPQAIELLTDKEAFKGMLDPEKLDEEERSITNVTRQRERLAKIDILVLQEMEIGIKRSHYLNAAGEMAKALNMNYAYAPQYLEVDPVILGVEKIELEEGGDDEEAMEHYRVDPEKHHGVFGSAVLSRYPIKHVEIRPLTYQPYDWYKGEKKKTTFLEKARRFGTRTAFKNEITREMKVGGRGYFRVDLDVPEVPGGTLTIINVHLEIKCQPIGREIQMREILNEIKKIEHPVVLLGDFNAAPTDISPTSVTRTVKRTLKNPTTWFSAAVSYLSPYGLAINSTRTTSNVTKNFNNPFAKDIDVVAPNPQYDMFNMIRNFRFKDGKAFDFRGNSERSIGAKNKMLANSNQRGTKGFKTTFSVKRALGIVGKYRLDWIFVKSIHMTKPREKDASYKLAPHFGETLEEMNTSLKTLISDHHPSLVDLPLEEPPLKSAAELEVMKTVQTLD